MRSPLIPLPEATPDLSNRWKLYASISSNTHLQNSHILHLLPLPPLDKGVVSRLKVELQPNVQDPSQEMRQMWACPFLLLSCDRSPNMTNNQIVTYRRSC